MASLHAALVTPLIGPLAPLGQACATGLALWAKHAASLPPPWTGVELDVRDIGSDVGAAYLIARFIKNWLQNFVCICRQNFEASSLLFRVFRAVLSTSPHLHDRMECRTHQHRVILGSQNRNRAQRHGRVMTAERLGS